MAVQSHIDSLKSRHQELEAQLSELMAGASAAPEEISDIKRRKLQLKDRIEQLSNQAQLN